MRAALGVAVLAAAAQAWDATLISEADRQRCGCTYVVNPRYTKIDGQRPFPYGFQHGSKLITPGDVLCLPAGQRPSLLVDGIEGTHGKVVTLRACTGLVTIDSVSKRDRTLPDGTVVELNIGGAITMARCTHLRLTGAGVAGVPRAITAEGAVTVRTFSSDVEVDHVTVQNAVEHGIKAKTDPTCDSATLRGNFVLRNLRIHDNVIRHIVDGEGMYIGHYAADGWLRECNGAGNGAERIYPHLLENVQIYNNKLYDTGADGIQLAEVVSGAVFSNEITHFGYHPGPALVGPNGETDHDNGIQVGHSNVHVHGNVVTDGPGNGIILHTTNIYDVDRVPHGTDLSTLPLVSGARNAMLTEHNTVTSVGESAVYIRTIEAATAWRVEENTFKSVGQFGVTGHSVDGHATRVEVRNNKYANVAHGLVDPNFGPQTQIVEANEQL